MSLRPREINFNEKWNALQKIVEGVITFNRVHKVERATWHESFSEVYQLCVAIPTPFCKDLYDTTKTFLESHVNALYQSFISSSSENLLNLYYTNWQEYSKGAEYLNHLFRYLNNQYVQKSHSSADIEFGPAVEASEHLLVVGEMALECWRKQMIEPLKDKLIKLILDEILKDRKSETINQTILHGVINSLVEVADKRKKTLELYETLFEKAFLERTGEFYKQEANRLIQENNCSHYMEKALAKLNEESLRSTKFLNPSSHIKISKECQQRLVEDYLEFLHSECKDLIKNEVKHDLKNMYKLLKPIPNGLTLFVEELQIHITRIGLESVKELKGDNIPNQFVEQMLQIHGKYSELIKELFNNDQEFVSALDKACSSAVNFKANAKMPSKSSELLAKYCDTLLRKSSKEFTENEIDDKLSSCITIFKYLDDKDYFQKFYWKNLAKRLINSLSFTMYAEENMINRLRQVCGYEFTNKFHRMFTDINLSQDLNEKFIQSCKNDGNVELDIDFSILILQAGAWPISQSNLISFSLPQELEKSVRTMEQFYSKSYSGRKLTWMHNLSNADVKVTYLKRPYFVTMGTFQMAILLCFNHSQELTVKDIQVHTQLQEKELIKQIQSLIESKLINGPKEQELNESSTVSLNSEYSNKRTKFKITVAVQKETPQETEVVQTSVDEDRKLYLQAAIVRIMKSRKQLNHNLLIQEVINQSKQRFNPSISLIKKCIETLIDKQYIERTKNKDEYSYIA